MAGVAGAGPVTGAPRPVHVVSRWQVSRLADLGAVCPGGHPAFPAFCGQWQRVTSPVTVAGAAALQGLPEVAPVAFPFHLSLTGTNATCNA